jgi:ABC-2 type transport system ATP-binding protein
MGDPVVVTEGLTKFYGRHRGLDGLDLEVRAGEIFGFLGPNGAGKTTTMRILLDLIRPTAGRAEVLGLDPRAGSLEIRRRCGYLPGELAVAGRQTARELLTFLGNLHGGADAARIQALADRLQLDLGRRVHGLSRGNQQKVGLVQAFMHDPELLILDEPTSGLDPLMRQEFLAMVREARDAGQTVLMSSHVLSEVQHVADRVGFIRDGRMVTVETVEGLRERAVRDVEIRFAEPVPADRFADLPGVRGMHVDGAVLRCTTDGKADALIKAAAAFTVLSFTSAEPDLEEVFLTYYDHDGGQEAGPEEQEAGPGQQEGRPDPGTPEASPGQVEGSPGTPETGPGEPEGGERVAPA